MISLKNRTGSIASAALIGVVVLIGGSLAGWKAAKLRGAEADAANRAEPMEIVGEAVAVERPHRATTTAIGTVVALRSIALRNEVPGVVRSVHLSPGRIVDAGTVLVAFDVSVEQAELAAQQAQAALAQTTLDRLERLREHEATSQEEVDQARAERDVALAQIARTKAIIARKTIRAPFRARVGLADVHPGQYLNVGTELTTLQGVADGSFVDFALAQQVAAGLRPGQTVEVQADNGSVIEARIEAVDARVDETTRTRDVRARLTGDVMPAPGASVRVIVPVGPEAGAVMVPASALRRGPQGDHVFVLATDSAGSTRARLRPVQAGPLVGNDIVILDGLEAGEHVAASGSFKLRPDALVMIAPPDTTPTAGAVQ
ncbi:MAG TPA: efflux RND transporter periplasmic adaptor subunit [Longimicrobiales bacterium]